MKIFIYSYGIPSVEDPMFGVFAFDQARALKSLGHEIVFIVLDLRSLRHRRRLFLNLYERDTIKVCHFSLPIGRMPIKLHDKVDIIIWGVLFKKIVKKYGKPEIIHSHFLRQGYSVSRLFRYKEFKLFCTIHDSHLMSNINNNDRFKLLQIHNNSTILTVSDQLSKRLDFIGVSSIIVNNMIDEDIFNYSINRKEDIRDIAVSAGALISRKGMGLLINVWRELPNYVKTKLIILGDGPERKTLTKMIRNYGLIHRIELRGKYDRNQFADYLNNAKYFVLASEKESFGVVYAEALMSGVPVIATKCGGPENLINKTNGILVEVNNHNQLLEGIIYMENKYTSYDSYLISKSIISEYSNKVVAIKLTELYVN